MCDSGIHPCVDRDPTPALYAARRLQEVFDWAEPVRAAHGPGREGYAFVIEDLSGHDLHVRIEDITSPDYLDLEDASGSPRCIC